MAIARMVHKKISISIQVNKLPLPARLLFTWMITHADDEGKLKGEPEYIKATVIPMTNWSEKRIESYLELIKEAGLIHYWQLKDEWFIQFAKWNEYQSIRQDRLKVSKLPSFQDEKDNQSTTNGQPADNQSTSQYNLIKSSPIQFNKSESSRNQPFADKKISSKEIRDTSSPQSLVPKSEGAFAALEVWKELEGDNLRAFKTTYLEAHRKGLPTALFYQFRSEIKQDSTIKNPGAVFNKKVEEYFSKRDKNKGGEAV